MTSVKTREVLSSLQAKGFRVSQSKHAHLVLYVDGKKSAIRTMVSQGGRDIGEPLIHAMARQLKISKAEFMALVECTLSEEALVEILRAKGVL